jgi:hypothetical protein
MPFLHQRDRYVVNGHVLGSKTNVSQMTDIETLRQTYIQKHAELATVVQQLEQELERMRSNEKVPAYMVKQRDEQITSIIDFNNASDELVNTISTGKPGAMIARSINESLGRLPPQAIDLEEKILGALMLEKNALNEVISYLKPEHFYKTSHELIYRAILALHENGAPVDMATVVNQLRKSGHIELIGGAYIIPELTAKVSSAANIEWHTRCMIEYAIKRQLIELASTIHEKAYDDTVDVFELLDATTADLNKIETENVKPKQATQ